jgi:hypothetical protein
MATSPVASTHTAIAHLQDNNLLPHWIILAHLKSAHHAQNIAVLIASSVHHFLQSSQK